MVPTTAIAVLAACVALELAWHRGVGECNVATNHSDAGTATLPWIALGIAGITAILGLRVGWRIQDWIELTALVIAVVSVVIAAIAAAFLVGVNFRGC